MIWLDWLYDIRRNIIIQHIFLKYADYTCESRYNYVRVLGNAISATTLRTDCILLETERGRVEGERGGERGGKRGGGWVGRRERKREFLWLRFESYFIRLTICQDDRNNLKKKKRGRERRGLRIAILRIEVQEKPNVSFNLWTLHKSVYCLAL